MQARLARFLRGYWRTLRKDGQTTSQWLFEYTIRSRIDNLVPVPSSTTDNPFRPEQTVWVKNNSPRDKWLPGFLKEASGHRLVQVSSPDRARLRHADQVRLLDDNSSTSPYGRRSDGRCRVTSISGAATKRNIRPQKYTDSRISKKHRSGSTATGSSFL